MATNDFIYDLVDKISEDNIEYILVTVQKGAKEHKATAHYNIKTVDGLDVIATTIDSVFENIAEENGGMIIDSEALPSDEDITRPTDLEDLEDGEIDESE